MCLSRWMFTCLQREYISICALFCWGGRGWAEGRLPVGPLCVGGLKFTRQKVTEKQKLSFCLLSIFFGSPQKMLELQPHTLRLPYPAKGFNSYILRFSGQKCSPFCMQVFLSPPNAPVQFPDQAGAQSCKRCSALPIRRCWMYSVAQRLSIWNTDEIYTVDISDGPLRSTNIVKAHHQSLQYWK